MPSPLDPYYAWLGIPPAEQPPSHYRLLGVPPFETNLSIIGNAADRQMAYVKTFLEGPHAETAKRVLEELRGARLCLFDAEKKAAYDGILRDRMAVRQNTPAAAPQATESVSKSGFARPAPRHGGASGAVLPPEASSPPPLPPPPLPPAASQPIPAPPPAPPATDMPTAKSAIGSRVRAKQGPRPEVLLILGGGALALLLIPLLLWFALSGASGGKGKDKVAQHGKKNSKTHNDFKLEPGKSGLLPDKGLVSGETDPPDESPPKETVPDETKPAETTPADKPEDSSKTPEGEPVKVPLPPAGVVTERVKVPDRGELAAASSQLKLLFQDRIDRAKTSQEKHALSNELLAEAEKLRTAPAAHYQTLDEAYKVAVAGGAYAQASRALDALTQSFEIDDALERRVDLLSKIKPNVKTNDQRWEIADEALALMPVLVADRRFDEAGKLGDLADQISDQLKHKRLHDLALKAKAEARIAKRDWTPVEEAIKKLKTLPDDAAANSVYGKYLCLVEGSFAKGLALLTKCDHAELKGLAERDLAAPTDAPTQNKLADDWQNLAKSDENLNGFLARAVVWYRLALSELSGAQKALVEKQIADLVANPAAQKLLDKPGVARVGFDTLKANLSLKERAAFPAHSSGVLCVAFSPDGKTLISSGADSQLKLWDFAAKTEKLALKGHTGAVTAVVAATDGKTLASCSVDGTVLQWTVPLMTQPMSKMKGTSPKIAGLAASPDDRHLASLGQDGSVSLWDVVRSRERQVFKAHDDSGAWLAFAPDGQRFATCGADKKVKVWSALGQHVATLEHADAVNTVAFSPDGKFLASGGAGKTVELWSTDKFTRVHTLAGHADAVTALAFSRDGSWLASTDAVGAIHLWDFAPGKEKTVLPARAARLHSLAFSFDGGTLAAASDNGDIVLYDVKAKYGAASAGAADLELPATQ